MTSHRNPSQKTGLTLRIVGAVLGSYCFTAALVGLSSVALPLWLDVPRGEAALSSAMIGFVLYLAALLWAFSEPRLTRVWAVLFGGAATSYGLTTWLAPALATVITTGG